MHWSILAVPLIVGLTAVPALADDTMATLRPEQIGQIFCLSRTGNDEAVIEGILSIELRAAIADALAKDEAWAKAHPGEKPPLGDGVRWQAWPDYTPDCTIGPVTVMESEASVEIIYGFPGTPHADFTDTLLLKRADMPGHGASFWRIDNIAYETGGDLKATLLMAFEGV